MIIKPFFIWANANDKLILAVVCKNGNPNEKTLKKFRYLIMRNAFKNGALNANDIDQPVSYPLVYRLEGEFKNAV